MLPAVELRFRSVLVNFLLLDSPIQPLLAQSSVDYLPPSFALFGARVGRRLTERREISSPPLRRNDSPSPSVPHRRSMDEKVGW